MITLWHRTSAEAAAQILSKGFRDGTGNYLTDREFSGVWLSDRLLDANEGAHGDTGLRITLNCTEDEIREFEWIEEGKGYREFLIPAAFITARGTVTFATNADWEAHDDRFSLNAPPNEEPPIEILTRGLCRDV
jgi:hypothetical protein